MAASSGRDAHPPAYESLIRGDRHNPSYVDMSEPNYESIIDTEAYYVMPNPPVAPTSVEMRDLNPKLPGAKTSEKTQNATPMTPKPPTAPPSVERNSTLYDNVKDKTVYPEPPVHRYASQDR